MEGTSQEKTIREIEQEACIGTFPVLYGALAAIIHIGTMRKSRMLLRLFCIHKF